MELHRDLDGLLHPLDDGVGVVGGAHPGHVLQDHRVGPHVLGLLGKIDVVVQVEDGPAHAPLGQRVAHRRLEVGHEAGLLGVHQGLDRHFPVAHVVKRVEDPEDVHPGLGGVAHEPVGEIVGVVPVSHQVLAPEQHHGGGLLQDPLDGADPLPGVVPQKTVGGVEGGAPPNLDGKVAHLVHALHEGNDVLGPHAGGQQRLVTVPKGGVGEFDGIFSGHG